MNTAILFRVWRIIRIPLGAILLLFIGLVIYRIPVVIEKQKTEEAVLKIHAQKITLDDVTGKNLPPDPGVEADKTVKGIDANRNGIRDDVELAIFREYPDSAKTRAALLQYAFVLQIEAVQPIINAGVVGEIANQQDRAIFCTARLFPIGGESSVMSAIMEFNDFMLNLQFNTDARRKAHKEFYSHLKSGRIDSSPSCDIDPDSIQ